MTDETPPLRADDEDRNRITTALGEALSRGQLSYAEFDERTGQAWAATHRAELLALLADLLPDPARLLDDRSPAPPGRAMIRSLPDGVCPGIPVSPADRSPARPAGGT